MAKLIYSALMSLDGYVADKNGHFDWAAPDEEVHTFINELERPVGTHLYGRRMYEVMAVWQTMPTDDEPACIGDFAQIWKAADKIVFSKTLKTVLTDKTQIETSFDPEAIRHLKATARQDISIGGAEIASAAFKAGLVDVCQFFISPVIVGGGKSALPRDVFIPLALQDERRFGSGVVFVEYEVGGVNKA
ncbi:MAG TPA: dihydrofolate reductase family protein [Thermoflexales bacterium]|nr:dihydrofolate reductase family protein [Thermoflexales bacterium]HQZ98703.1 dihydrofolate reductase family protein [Thermoflexales bacterium]